MVNSVLDRPGTALARQYRGLDVRGMRVRGSVLLLFALTACGESTGPPTRSISLDLCDDSQWIGYQNEGGTWTTLGPGNGAYIFAATERLVIARAHIPDGSPASAIFVDYLTADQVATRLGCRMDQALPGSIGGDVAGLDQLQFAGVSFNGSVTYVPPGSTEWSLQAQPVPATLFAARFTSGTGSLRSDRIIMRRDRSYVPGAGVPLLDFNSNEAFDPDVNALSFTGGPATLYAWFVTGGHAHVMSSYPNGTFGEADMARSVPMHTVPVDRLGAGDLHFISLLTSGQLVQLYVRDASDRTVTLGPPPATPTLTTVATTPYRRLRVDLPSQPEYPDEVSVELYQTTGTTATRFRLRATREYFGNTPDVWSLTVPDLGGVGGAPHVTSLGESAIGWAVSASSGRFGLAPGNAQDGDRVTVASHSGVSP